MSRTEKTVSAPMLVRAAVVADARAIATIHVDAWRVAYAHIFEPAVFEQPRLSFEKRAEAWHAELTAPGRGRHVAVAEVAGGGEVVGFCASGPSRDEDPAGVGEVYAVYIAPGQWGRGAGRALMDAAQRALRQDGFAEAVLWVLEDNVRARGFYERSGWVLDGATKHYESIIAVRYRIALDRNRP
jgi:ribosomal protein S18 acetylase RimI-like enzyme